MAKRNPYLAKVKKAASDLEKGFMLFYEMRDKMQDDACSAFDELSETDPDAADRASEEIRDLFDEACQEAGIDKILEDMGWSSSSLYC